MRFDGKKYGKIHLELEANSLNIHVVASIIMFKNQKSIVIPKLGVPNKNKINMPSCFLMYWSGFQMVGLGYSPKTDHLKSELQKIWYSNVSGIPMVGIQIPI